MEGRKWIINFVLPLGLIIYGYLYKHKASKKVSKFFGYKTARTQLSQETWEYANIRVGNIWIKLGAFYTIFTMLILLVFPSQREKLSLIVFIVGVIVTLYPFSLIENELKEKFDEKGELK